jgi:hypothetical protein
METETLVQAPAEPRLRPEDWTEAEWFQEWLRLARREYQGQPKFWYEFSEAA